jgi:hypothetical protein
MHLPFLGSPMKDKLLLVTSKCFIWPITLHGTVFLNGIINIFQPRMILSLDDFRIMPFDRKCDVITFHGNYIVHRPLGECKVFLYHANDFFIEVFFSTTHQKVLMINAFDNHMGLQPYLDKISLADLFEDSI